VNAPDEDGATPLHYAAAGGDIRLIRLLLEAGADRSRVDSSGHAAVDWLTGVTAGSKALWLLVGMDPPPRKDREKPLPTEPGPLEQAIRAGDLDLVASLIGDDTGETSADEFSNSPIGMAVLAGRLEVIEFLAKRGADVNRKDENRWTLLTAAAECGQLEVVGTLLDLGAQIDLPGGDTDTLTPLQIASRDGHAAIAELLLQRGADPNLTEDSDGWTALHYAAFKNRPRIIRLLLKHGANLHAYSSIYDMSRTPLELAVRYCRRRAARVLYSEIAKQYPEAYGSPLHAAAEIGDPVLARELIETGAGINAVDYKLQTPLHWAVGQRRPCWRS